MRKRIIVGSRKSKLAMIQTRSVLAKIKGLNSDIEFSVKNIVTKGDLDRQIPFDKMEGIGVFVKELEKALSDGLIDFVVHSMKDVPTQIPQGLCLIAVTERLDPRDVLVSKAGSLSDLSPGSKIGTGSPRRAIQLITQYPQLEPCSIRGNIDTRLRKVDDGEFDGVIVAASALKRLGIESRISEYLPVEHFLPAIGQGALAIEMRLNDKDIAELLSSINHLPTWQEVSAERAFLNALGGGCRTPIAALGRMNGDTLRLQGMVADCKKKRIINAFKESSSISPEELGVQLAKVLLGMGAGELIYQGGGM